MKLNKTLQAYPDGSEFKVSHLTTAVLAGAVLATGLYAVGGFVGGKMSDLYWNRKNKKQEQEN